MLPDLRNVMSTWNTGAGAVAAAAMALRYTDMDIITASVDTLLGKCFAVCIQSNREHGQKEEYLQQLGFPRGHPP